MKQFLLLLKSISTISNNFNAQDEKVGRVTSGTMSPSTQKAIGLGYVSNNNSDDSSLFLGIRNKKIPIKKVKLPFYKK